MPQMQHCPNQLFHCQVEFRGPDVYKGIQQMVASGIATGRLPKHLAAAHTLGSTKILITSEIS